MSIKLVTPKKFIFTALPCEAKPIIDGYKLKKDIAIQSFSVFQNDEITLTVTGIGKVAMAAGVAYTQALFPSSIQPIMLNVGIAGHKSHPIGELFLIDKITDSDTGKNYYSPLVFTPPCPTHCLQTVSKPQLVYPEMPLCDMEASAFYETAVRFSTGELIHCLKIISDNEIFPTQHVEKQKVTSMIAEKMQVIDSILTSLTNLADSLNLQESIDLGGLLTRYHFTVYEQIQLKKQLNRWRLVTGKDASDLPFDSAKSGKDVIRLLDESINQVEFYL